MFYKVIWCGHTEFSIIRAPVLKVVVVAHVKAILVWECKFSPVDVELDLRYLFERQFLPCNCILDAIGFDILIAVFFDIDSLARAFEILDNQVRFLLSVGIGIGTKSC